MSEALAGHAAGIVVDVRDYPAAETSANFNRLFTKPVPLPIFRIPQLIGAERREVLEVADVWPKPADAPVFDGPLVMLVGQRSVSQSETFAMMLADSGRATIVGRTTAGTDGNMTGVLLPGGFGFSFSGLEVLHQDRRAIFGVGVIPDVQVRFVASDLAEGRDPELLEAIQVLARGR